MVNCTLMTLDDFDQLPFEEAKTVLLACCGCEAWAVEMAAGRPYRTLDEVMEAAEKQWWRLGEYGWMEAFRAHAETGRDAQQRDVGELLKEYYATFGFGFIVADDKMAGDELVKAVRGRVENRPEEEIAVAAEEEAAITRRRLEQLMSS